VTKNETLVRRGKKWSRYDAQAVVQAVAKDTDDAGLACLDV